MASRTTDPRSIARDLSGRSDVFGSETLITRVSGSHALLLALVTAILYYVGCRIGFLFKAPHQAISTIWPPNAALLATLLLAPPRKWWMLIAAVLPAHLAAQLPMGVPIATALGWYVSNCAEAVVGAASIQYFLKRNSLFDNVRGVVTFLLCSVMLAPLTTSFLDAAVVIFTNQGRDYWFIWGTRLFSNMLAQLTVVPLIVRIARGAREWVRHARVGRYVEGALLALSVTITSFVVFGESMRVVGSAPALVYLPLPLLLWAAVRFGPGSLSGSLLIIALISMWNAIHGSGLYSPTAMASHILSLQVLLCVIAVPLMLLAAHISERRALEDVLRETSGKLIDSAERERQRFAGQLHDDIGQQLSLLAVEVDQLRSGAAGIAKSHLDHIYDRACGVSKATRDLSQALYSSHLEYLDVAPALRTLCQRISSTTRVTIQLVEEDLPAGLPKRLSLCLYRIVEEALGNIVKHSNAGKAVVEVKATRNHLLLRIQDDGVGLPLAEQSHAGFGLTAIRERTNAMRGTLEIISRPMRGTAIEVSLPLEKRPKAA